MAFQSVTYFLMPRLLLLPLLKSIDSRG